MNMLASPTPIVAKEKVMSMVEALRNAYQLWDETKGKEAGQFMDLMADHVVFRSLAGGASPMEFTITRQGKHDVMQYFAGLAADWEMMHYKADEFIEQGDRVVMLGSCAWKSRKTQKIVDTPKADFFRISNGKIVEFFEFYDTARAM